jgi:NAD(P)-dependent dehydrogenase (short-subunit alcohol dehydrogenase family)
MSAKLNHARVLVVGGSSGIGLATAAAAAEAGAAVTIASRSQTRLESAVSALGKTARAVRVSRCSKGASQRSGSRVRSVAGALRPSAGGGRDTGASCRR